MVVWHLLLLTTLLGSLHVDGIEQKSAKVAVDTALAGLGQIPDIVPYLSMLNPLIQAIFGSESESQEIEIIKKGFRDISAQLTASVNNLHYAIGKIHVEEIGMKAHALMNSFNDIFKVNNANSHQHLIKTFLSDCEEAKPYNLISNMEHQWTKVLKLSLEQGLYPSMNNLNSTMAMMSNILNQLTIAYLSQQFLYGNEKKEERVDNIQKLERQLDTIENTEEEFLKEYLQTHDYRGVWKNMEKIIDEAMTNKEHGQQQVKADVMWSLMSDVYMHTNGTICSLTLSHEKWWRAQQLKSVFSGGEKYYHDETYGIIIFGGSMNGVHRNSEETMRNSLNDFLGKYDDWKIDPDIYGDYAKSTRQHVVIERPGFDKKSIFECQGDGFRLDMTDGPCFDTVLYYREDEACTFHVIAV